MIHIDISTVRRSQLEKRLTTVINKAHKSRCTSCMYCSQNDFDFIDKFGHSKIATPAFFCEGRWFHLNLRNKNDKFRGGYRWHDCDGGWGNGMLVAAGLYRNELADAVRIASEIEALSEGKLSFQSAMLTSIFMGGNMLVKGHNPIHEEAQP